MATREWKETPVAEKAALVAETYLSNKPVLWMSKEARLCEESYQVLTHILQWSDEELNECTLSDLVIEWSWERRKRDRGEA